MLVITLKPPSPGHSSPINTPSRGNDLEWPEGVLWTETVISRIIKTMQIINFSHLIFYFMFNIAPCYFFLNTFSCVNINNFHYGVLLLSIVYLFLSSYGRIDKHLIYLTTHSNIFIYTVFLCVCICITLLYGTFKPINSF